MRTTRRFTAAARRRFTRSSACLTGAVGVGTLIVSVAALVSPALMQVLTRDLGQLRAGQWWRMITPVFVQPDGWGQLVFNLLGLAIVGAALEHRTTRTAWALTFVVGGVGGIAVTSAWHPADLGGGSSDAVAALIGALTVLRFAERHRPPEHHDPSGRRSWAGWAAQLYCVFFAAYLTALDLGGVWWSILVGNASIVAFFVARRALRPTALNRACLLTVGAAGVAMIGQHDGHGFGIIAGAGAAALALLRGLRRPAHQR